MLHGVMGGCDSQKGNMLTGWKGKLSSKIGQNIRRRKVSTIPGHQYTVYCRFSSRHPELYEQDGKDPVANKEKVIFISANNNYILTCKLNEFFSNYKHLLYKV